MTRRMLAAVVPLATIVLVTSSVLAGPSSGAAAQAPSAVRASKTDPQLRCRSGRRVVASPGGSTRFRWCRWRCSRPTGINRSCCQPARRHGHRFGRGPTGAGADARGQRRRTFHRCVGQVRATSGARQPNPARRSCRHGRCRRRRSTADQREQRGNKRGSPAVSASASSTSSIFASGTPASTARSPTPRISSAPTSPRVCASTA